MILFFVKIFLAILLQIGLIAVGFIAWSIYTFNIRTTKSVYGVAIFLIFLLILFPLHLLLDRSPLLWIIQLIFQDGSTVSNCLHFILNVLM